MDFKKTIKLGQLELWQKYTDYRRANPELTYLFWETTLRCNLSCLHCGSACGPNQKVEGELKTEEIKKALQSISRDFQVSKITLAITGGEPLIRKDVFKVIKYATELGFNCGMVTNGTLVTKEVAKRLKEAGIKSITVSLDGQEKEHEYLRGKGNYEKAVAGLKNLVAQKFPLCEIITCVNRENIKKLEDIYELVRCLGVKEWRLFMISPIGRAKEMPSLFLTAGQLKQLLNFIKEKRGGKSELKVSFEEEGFLGLEYEREVRDSFFFCLAGIHVASILYDGSISACPSLPRDFIQGNIRKDNFKKVWEEKFQQFRHLDWKKKGICQSCEQWDYCHGNGMHLWDFTKSEPSFCEYHLLNSQI